MSDENSCCGFKKKTVVMSFIGLMCLTLVVWTVMVTAGPPSGTDIQGNVSRRHVLSG